MTPYSKEAMISQNSGIQYIIPTGHLVNSLVDQNTGWWKTPLSFLWQITAGEIDRYSGILKRYIIPMLWLGGALAQTGITIEKTGSQVDIPLTILRQLGLDGDYPFSKDLLSAGSGSFAFYTFNEGFGFITDSSKYIYEHKLGDSVIREGKDPDTAGRNGKAFLQVLYDDFLKGKIKY